MHISCSGFSHDQRDNILSNGLDLNQIPTMNNQDKNDYKNLKKTVRFFFSNKFLALKVY